jgi:flagellar secretion chaperone FliS
MIPQARENYLVTEVMTAPPQKLHLMLIEGAIRLVHKARQHWAAKEDQPASDALIHAQKIVAEILAGFKRDVDPGLVKQVAAVYAFVYRNLIEAAFLHDDAKLGEALRVLDIERGTWRQVCEQLVNAPPAIPPRPSAISPIPPRILESRPMDSQPVRWSLEA